MDEITKMMQAEITNYGVLAERVGDMVLMNQITSVDDELLYEPHNGETEYCIVHDPCNDDVRNASEDHCEYEQHEIYQFYAITSNGAEFLTRNTNEIVLYSNELDAYFWGICHFGTAWGYVNFSNWK